MTGFIQFGNLTTWNAGWLDQNFNSCGLLGTLPCTVTGTNNLVLTQTGGIPQPTVTLQQGASFSAIAANNNSGSVTAAVAGMAALNVYKDTPTGPALLTGGEIVANNLFELIYDATLNGGAGGYHLQTAPASSAGTVTSVATGTGLTGGTITTTGTISLANIANNDLLANISGGSAAPIANTLTAILDAVFSSTQGSTLARGSSLWTASGETTYAPALAFGGASTGITYSTQAGFYQSLGFITIVVFNLVLTSNGSATGSASISLPANSGGGNRVGGGLLTSYSGLTSLTTLPFLQIGASAAVATLAVAGSATTTAVTNSNVSSTATLAGVMAYFTG